MIEMSPRVWLVLGALSAAIGVGLGAYHAHGLEKMLQMRLVNPADIDHQMRDFEVGVRYQLMHAVAISNATTRSVARRPTPLRGRAVGRRHAAVFRLLVRRFTGRGENPLVSCARGGTGLHRRLDNRGIGRRASPAW